MCKNKIELEILNRAASVTMIGKGNYGGTKTVKIAIKAKRFLWWWR